jgi:hypothetical protein
VGGVGHRSVAAQPFTWRLPPFGWSRSGSRSSRRIAVVMPRVLAPIRGLGPSSKLCEVGHCGSSHYSPVTTQGANHKTELARP